ncbi:MAG: T9SS type A sorting domain-containing protein [Chitinophagaceae bacterium]|nr:T9SS type A sorting domain-containing protein [Chitinophagaceae bacterium]
MPISTIPAKNTSQNFYNIVDKSILITNLSGRNALYYRLKISDKAGRYKYTEVAKISLGKTSTDVIIGPNPFVDYISVYSSDAILLVNIFDISGKLVYSTTNVVGNKIFFDKIIPTGTYIVKVQTSKEVVIARILKAN